MRRIMFVCFALSVLVLQTTARAPQYTESSNRIIKVDETTNSFDSTTTSSASFMPQQLLQIIQQNWRKIMKKFNYIAQVDGLTDMEIIRRRELGIIV